jgi:ech hydrogenase subunit A
MTPFVTFLVAFPVAAGLLALLLPGRARDALVVCASVVIGVASVATVVHFANGPQAFFGLPLELELGRPLFAAELAIAALLIVLSLRHRRLDALALAVLQAGTATWMELSGRLPAPDPLRLLSFDRLSMVMVLVIGLIGPLICIQAVGYMRDYHRHYPLILGRRRMFFFLLLAFLSAMFGLVCANDLAVLHLFWELTTLCSFLLIGYTRTAETLRYAFNALSMNLLGGLGFTVAMAILATSPSGLDLAALCAGPGSAAVLPAVALLALAGLTKSAQLPFSSWLLGAMYAPTPTSALLHSSTMVKAGVFLLLRLSPAMAGSVVGTTVAMVGFLTFLAASLIATTEPNAKRILAWSTISNLGLIAGCAGVATPAMVWVGVMVVIFHAVAKSLLFLVVGSLENRLYTKDLESFDHLLARFPRLAALALAGVSGMALAPFGVVLAKWSAIRALLEVPGWRGALFLLALAYGSACTVYYWTKVLMKLVAIRGTDPEDLAIEARVTGFEWFSEGAHAALLLGVTLGVGALSDQVVGPYALGAFGAAPTSLLHVAWPVVVVLALSVLALPLMALGLARSGKYRYAEIYVSGRNADERHLVQAAAGDDRPVRLRNYYLTGVVDGAWVFRTGTALAVGLVALMVFLPTLVLP